MPHCWRARLGFAAWCDGDHVVSFDSQCNVVSRLEGNGFPLGLCFDGLPRFTDAETRLAGRPVFYQYEHFVLLRNTGAEHFAANIVAAFAF